ncbi:MAG TPA: chitobiase/beta-hexosaminidase C-terminal domain-containing protein [Candidatus Angelobacter sp.]|nr:chitobiase/beta-hexosaminidase C-terminal domain-containing protein [Candidatus Angelobacter sp.]
MNPLQQLQQDAVAYLLGNPATASVGYESFRQQAVDGAVKQAIAGWSIRAPGKTGVYCLVLMPSFFVEDPNVPGVQGSVELTIRTFEDPKINNTNLTAEDVALANLHWFGDGLVIAGLLAIYPSTKGPALKPNYDYPGFLVYDTVLRGQLPQDYPGRTAAPTIANNSGTVTLACGDGVATIFYTLDGSMPQPGDTSGTAATKVYSTPFGVPNGTIVRCLAWNSAILPSDVEQATVNF